MIVPTVFKSLSQFEPIRILRSGIFGRTIYVRCPDGATDYVIKETDYTIFNKVFEIESSSRLLLAITRNEHAQIQKLQHPNFVKVLGSFQEYTDQDFLKQGSMLNVLVMESCDGSTLEAAINEAKQKQTPFPEPQIQVWTRQLLSATSVLFERKIFHGDIKPNNIFLAGAERTIKLGDFGDFPPRDRLILSEEHLGGVCFNVDLYSAPEFLDGAACMHKCDIWSIGVVLFQVANLKLPFPSLAAIILKPPGPFSSEYSSEFREFVIQRLLAKEPENRPTVDEIVKQEPFLLNGLDLEIIRETRTMPPSIKDAVCKVLTLEKTVSAFKLLYDPTAGDIKAMFKDAEVQRAVLNWRLLNYANWKSEQLPELGKKLHAAVASGDLSVVKEILNSPKIPPDGRRLLLERKNKENDTALTSAAVRGHLNIVRYLVEEAGADLELRGRYDRTAFLRASQKGHLAVVEYLMNRKGINLEARDSDQGSLAIHLAATFGNIAIVSFLLDKKSDWLEAKCFKYNRTPLLHATVRGNLPVVEFLLKKKGADIYATDSVYGDLAIHVAAFYGHTTVIAILLERREDLLDAKNKQGQTPYGRAKGNNQETVMQFLESKGSKLN